MMIKKTRILGKVSLMILINEGIKSRSNRHEMEDYCLKLVEIDEKVKEWSGITVEELASQVKGAKYEGANKSSLF